MKDRFIARVMQIMNELGWEDRESEGFICSDGTKVKEHIESVFIDAWLLAVKLFPADWFACMDFSGCEIVSDPAQGTGYVILPGDFHRLVSFRLKGWRKAVTLLPDYNEALASIQANRYTRGNFYRPVCMKHTLLIVREGEFPEDSMTELRQVLLYYSLPPGASHAVQEALYIPLATPLDEETQIKDNLFVPLAYLCASLVYSLMEKNQIAEELKKTALSIYR